MEHAEPWKHGKVGRDLKIIPWAGTPPTRRLFLDISRGFIGHFSASQPQHPHHRPPRGHKGAPKGCPVENLCKSLQVSLHLGAVWIWPVPTCNEVVVLGEAGDGDGEEGNLYLTARTTA